ncbi:hypothetical protein RSOLAG22IIIB_13630 [Rhizoctonia solani]|uniref:Homeobox domain-containing protein n=1 Tax=Rhizoctonia solani TaxID=456999 RepID=A0A0K6FPC0_9AGAM|nr:hypothetical protein RSOLAG22IIIB_13630 [Rhizoctonia solani]
MSESSFLEVASAIRRALQQNIPVTQYPSTNRPTIEQLTPQPPIPQPFIDLSHHASSWKLPETVSSELAALIPTESMKYQDIAGRAHVQLLQELYASCDSVTVANLVPHAQAARDALHARMVNTLLDSVHQLALSVDHDNGVTSDADESSESDSESGSEEEEEDEDDTEVIEDPDEDENTPMKPGEEVPPLETKYLPIFEALHERGKVLTKPEKTYLVNLTGMTYRQITIWFQNRRRGELKEDMNARLQTYPLSTHSDQSSDLSEDDVLEKKLSMAQPSDTTFNIRSWRLASAVASGDLAPAFPPSPTKVGFTDTSIPRPDMDDSDSDLSDSDDDLDRSDNGARVPSLTTSSIVFDSSSDRGPATIGSASSSQAIPGMPSGPVVVVGKTSLPEQNVTFARPVKQLPSRRTTPPATQQPQRLEHSQQPPAYNFNFTAPPVNTNPPKQFVSVPPAQPPQFVTSNERGLTVEMGTTPPKSTITLQSSSSTTPVAKPSHAPSSPVLPSGSPNLAPSPSPSGNSGSSPRPAVKPLPRRTGCAPRPRPPPRVGSIATSTAVPGSARSSVVLAPVVLPPSSNPSLAGTTLGALLRPNVPPPNIPPELEERLSAMAGRMGVGATGNGQRRNPSTDVTGLNRPRPTFNPGPPSLPGARMPPGLPRGSSPKA